MSSVFAVSDLIVRNLFAVPALIVVIFTDMEAGNHFIEILTYGVIAFVVLAMIALLIRTLTLVIGFLSLTLADAWYRWRPTRDEVQRVEEGKSPHVPD